jgi:hypothetical protein
MNIIGVEPRLSMLEAEVEQLETGGGGGGSGGGSGGECLWENFGSVSSTYIQPKNNKNFLVSNGDKGVEVSPGVVQVNNVDWGHRVLDAIPLGDDDWQVISVQDLDGTTIKRNGEKIQAVIPESLWEPDGTSTTIITPKNHKGITIRYKDAPASIYASLSSVGLSVNGSKPRNLSGTSFPLSTSYMLQCLSSPASNSQP